MRGARLALGGFALNRGLMFGVYIALARIISPADFGHFAAASVVTGVGQLFAESGMMSALIRTREQIEEAASTAFYSLVISGILLTAVAAAVAPLIGLLFRSSLVTALSAALAGVLLLNALIVVPDALLQRRFSFMRRVAVDPLSAVAFAIGALVACTNGAGPWGLVIGTYAASLVGLVASWAFAGFRPQRRQASLARWRQLATFARPVLGSEMLSRVATQLDVILLGRFKGAAPLGQYKNGLRIGQMPADAFVNVVAYVLLPALVRISDHPARLADAARRIYRLVAAAVLPASLMLAPLGAPLGVLLLGSRWRLAGHAIAALCGLLIARVTISVASEVFKAVGRPALLVRVHFVSLCTMAVFVGATAVPFGVVGVAVGVSVSQCVTAGYALHLCGPLTSLGRRDLVQALSGPALAAAVMVGAMVALVHSSDPLAHSAQVGWAIVVAVAIAGGLIYLAVLVLIDPSRRHDAAAFGRFVLTGERSAGVRDSSRHGGARMSGEDSYRPRRLWVRALKRIASRRAVILGYHGVGNTPRADDLFLLQVSPDRFRAQLEMMRDAGFQFVTVSEMMRIAGDRPPPAGLAAVSFDDGMRNNLTEALPILRDLGIPATVYVPSGWLGGSSPWVGPDGDGEILTGDELGALADAGWEIGAHTINHADLSTLRYDECLAEITGCCEELERITGVPVRTLAYPFGHYNDTARRAAEDAGLTAAVTTGSGKWEPFELTRAMVGGADPFVVLLLKMTDRYESLLRIPPLPAVRRSSKRLRQRLGDRRRLRAGSERSNPSNRLGRLLPHLPALVPGLIGVAVMLVWAVHNGGYDADTWYWGALLALGALSYVVWSRRRSITLSRTARIALSAFALYVAWSYLSITWAESKGDALNGSNRALLYLLVFSLFVVLPWTPRAALTAIVTFALGLGVIAIVLLARLSSSDHVGALVIDGRLAAPTGYFNGTAALFTIAALLSIALAARRELAPELRGVLTVTACAGLQLGVIVQSRGWLFTLGLVALFAVVVVRDRLRFAAAAVLPVLAAVIPIGRLLDVYKATGAQLPHAAGRAGTTALVICGVVLIVATLVASAERLFNPAPLSPQRRRALGVAVVVLVLAGGAAGALAATHGHPFKFIERQWNGFSHEPTTSAGSHFADVGSGRYDFWRVALKGFGTQPIGGLGQDNFGDYYLLHRRTSEEPAWPHSLELRLLVSTGIVGFLLFGTWIVQSLRIAARGRRAGGLSAEVAGIAMLPFVVWLIHGSIDWFWELPAISGPALAFLGIAVALSEQDRSVLWRRRRAHRIPRPVTIGAVCLAEVACLFALGTSFLSVREVSNGSDASATNPAAALHDFKLAADFNPLSSIPGRLSGLVALENGEFHTALQRFRQSLSNEPLEWVAWLGAGLAQSELGDRAAADRDFVAAARIIPGQTAVQQALARVYSSNPLTPSEALRLFAVQG